jgi:tRNA-specific 2-thiouridylase
VFGNSLKKKVFVGLSGGVDSSVSAALLKQKGYDVTAVFIRIAIEGYPCPAAEDRIEAMRAAAHLKVPFVEVDLSKEYQARVFEYAVKEFAKGHTPNPDALCNKEIKFGVFYDFALSHGAEYVATGHYARLEGDRLLTAIDANKDQSYFLWAVPQEHLKKVFFPVGNLTKPEVRALAKKFKLPNARRPDSQGLCFLGDISIEDMLKKETSPVRGDVLLESGEVVGTHEGASLYTLGQRHGFGLHAQANDTKPHYVVAKDQVKNTITVSTHKFPIGVSKTIIILKDENWIGEVESGAYEARFRYRQKLIPATLEKSEKGSRITLHEAHYVPEGQSLVLYGGSRCMGGGIIDAASLV